MLIYLSKILIEPAHLLTIVLLIVAIQRLSAGLTRVLLFVGVVVYTKLSSSYPAELGINPADRTSCEFLVFRMNFPISVFPV